MNAQALSDGAALLVSRRAIRDNLALLRERVAPAELLAVVKDDAYGHGAPLVIDTLADSDVTRFGALDLDGALLVREHAPTAMIFAWVFGADDDLVTALRADIELGVTDARMLERVAAAAAIAGTAARIHIKVDSGLHRAGILPAHWTGFIARVAQLQQAGRVVVAGVWTHLAEASDEDDSRSIAVFRRAVEVVVAAGLPPGVRHVAASAAAYARSDARFDMVRIGAFLYGIAPGGGIGPAELGLRPAMTLTAPVLEMLTSAGRDLAVIELGGAAGVLGDAAGTVTVAIGGRRHPLVAVQPTHSLIDVTGAPVSAGETVTLFGDGDSGEPTLQELADAMGTIGEEIVTRLSARLPRVVVD